MDKRLFKWAPKYRVQWKDGRIGQKRGPLMVGINPRKCVRLRVHPRACAYAHARMLSAGGVEMESVLRSWGRKAITTFIRLVWLSQQGASGRVA